MVVTFGPGESNLASAPAFPVLIGNALDWLVAPEPPRRRPRAGSFDDAVARVTGPDGAPVPLARVIGDRARACCARPAFYVADEGGARSTFAVNVGDPAGLERRPHQR